ncbi:choice-of-anchor I family protein [Halobacillus litoralis]|uniref:choice-of-anchor I family protein n=1 Tax=Halobacillus litoralis TaxID=45668 RepID=UPI001CFE67AB|nr:choice-of-anchor I family protein [Halobacillus litoralis]
MFTIRKTLAAGAAVVTAFATLSLSNPALAKEPTEDLEMHLLGNYDSGAGLDEGGAEIVAYNAGVQRAYSINSAANALDILDMSKLHKGNGKKVQDIPLYKRVSLAELAPELGSVDGLTSIAVSPDGNYIAVAVVAEPKTEAGHIVFLDLEGNYLNQVEVGSLPDMVTFTHDGKKLLVANEGEPNEDVTIDPEGSVSIIDVTKNVKDIDQESITTAAFTDQVQIDENVRVVKPNATAAQDFEPEYISVSKDDKWAYVALQEANAIAKLNLETGRFTHVHGLGFKDHSLQQNSFDASNKDGEINLTDWPVLGMYMPDGIAYYSKDGKNYILTPNEGDAMDYDGFSEEVRVEDLKNQYDLNAENYQGYTQDQLDKLVANGLFKEENLGRLKTTTAMPVNNEGNYEAIYGYGARSFSIWNAEDMSLVYDSGSDFEQIIADQIPDYFNTTNDENEFDSRSDDKGPEPEAVVTGEIAGSDYAFIGLERMSGIMIYNIDDPEQPEFVEYIHSRDFSGEVPGGDVAPEGLKFIPAEESPTKLPLLLTGNEVSGTVAAYEVTKKSLNGNKGKKLGIQKNK